MRWFLAQETMRSKPVFTDLHFENHQHPNTVPAANNAATVAADDQNVYRAHRRGNGGRHPLFAPPARPRLRDPPVPQPAGGKRFRGAGLVVGADDGVFLPRWLALARRWSAVRTAGRSVGEFDGRRRGWFRRQIDADGLFLGWTLPVSFLPAAQRRWARPGMFEGISAINIWWFR